MPKTRRYRTVAFEAPPGKKLGDVHLAENEYIRREVMFLNADTGLINCTILIQEKVDKAKEKQLKNEQKERMKEREETVFKE